MECGRRRTKMPRGHFTSLDFRLRHRQQVNFTMKFPLANAAMRDDRAAGSTPISISLLAGKRRHLLYATTQEALIS